MAREAGDDLPRLAAVLPDYIEVPRPGDPESFQPSLDGSESVVVPVTVEFESDAASRRFAFSTAGVDELENLYPRPRGPSGGGCWSGLPVPRDRR